MIRGTTQQSSAPYNRRIVLDMIRRQGSASRKEIVDRVYLSPQTVANITNELEEVGLIVAKRLQPVKSRGQRPIAFELNPNGGNSIGISLGPRGAKAVLVNLVGTVIKRHEAEFDARDQRLALVNMIDLVKILSAHSATRDRLWGVGVALPGPLTVSDISFKGPSTLEGWTDLSVLDDLQRLTGLNVVSSVDSVAGALGESLFGVAKNLTNFFYLHFGVGLGGSLVVAQSSYKGANGNATEIGHIPVVANGKPCYCGNSGCLEQYLSIQSLSDALAIPDLHEHGHETLETMFAVNHAGLLAWCAQAADHLRNAICTIENMLDPQSIVIGGSAPKILTETLARMAEPLSHSVRGGLENIHPRIILSAHDEDSSLLGAAVLPIHEMLSPRLSVQLEERRQDLKVAGLMGQKSVAGSTRY